ncbi:DnaJ protein P58IPK homolog [Geodia barretti]|uniref:DnaJ protein P58IPK homolog n=1 Tax=Geodia barretti TaxID=519541 RepID=A0AA35TPJ2_GEOBA|nr:DnaJ protein P58IPK homolog [Geodia barretti]
MGLTREEALKIMGLEEGCSTKEVRDRFKKLALKWHPDKNIDNPDDAQKKFQAISAAYTKLVSSDSEEEDDDIPNDSLREMFARIWQSHNRGAFSSDPHLFCDCDACQADWEDLSLDDFIGSDSDPDDDFYYDDSLYADDLLRQFGEKLYRKYNEPSGRAEKKAKQMWTGSGYRGSVTAEEASRNADELLEAEEKEKRAAEKKKKRNRKKKESKKRRKAKPEDGCSEETPPPDKEEEEEEEEEEVAKEEEGRNTRNMGQSTLQSSTTAALRFLPEC